MAAQEGVQKCQKEDCIGQAQTIVVVEANKRSSLADIVRKRDFMLDFHDDQVLFSKGFAKNGEKVDFFIVNE